MIDFLDLSTYEKRSDWILELVRDWSKMKKDIDRLIEVCSQFITKDKENE